MSASTVDLSAFGHPALTCAAPSEYIRFIILYHQNIKKMYRTFVNINKAGKGFFALQRGGVVVGTIGISISGGDMVLRNTIVSDMRHLESVAGELLRKIAGYARLHELEVMFSKMQDDQKHLS
jgi:N-acetylglutamate synthase-like GNAT family acetyltransferase